MLLDLAARILLLPVLIGQAIFVVIRIPKLPEASGPRAGTVGQGPRLRLLVLGDSSAAGVGAATQDKALLGRVLNSLSAHYTIDYELIARTRARTGDALNWLRGRPAKTYDVVICALGGNDVTKDTPLRRFLRLQMDLVDHLQFDRGAQLVVVSDLPPVAHFPALPQPLRWVLGRQANRLEHRRRQLLNTRRVCIPLAFDLSLDVSAMASDGFHPGPDAYAAWGKAAAAIIRERSLRLDDDAASP